MNSCSVINGKRIALTTRSPRTLLLTLPPASKPCFPHSFVAQRLTAANRSISLMFRVSLSTKASSTDLSIDSADSKATFVCLSISFQQWSNSFLSSCSSATGKTLNTSDGYKLSSRNSLHLSASEGTMYFFAKYSTCNTLLPVKVTSSLYKKRTNSNKVSNSQSSTSTESPVSGNSPLNMV